MLGVDPAFDRRPGDADVLLGDGQRRAGGDLDLLVDEIDAGDHFGDGMFDLDAGVHFDEIEAAVLVEEFDGADADVFELGHGARDDGADLLALGGVQRRGGAFLPHFLMAPLQRTVALAQMDRPTQAVAEHLDFDMTGLARYFSR